MRQSPNLSANVLPAPLAARGGSRRATSDNSSFVRAPEGKHQSSATPDVFIVNADAAEGGALQSTIQGAGWRTQAFASQSAFLSNSSDVVRGCVVLDISQLEPGDLLLKRLLVEGRIALPVICLMHHSDVPLTVRAMKAGAIDVLIKPVKAEPLLNAVRYALLSSEAAFPEVLQVRQLQDRYACLSQRERQVMALVVTGLLNKQVGGDLGISEITVKAHRGQVMRKMRAGSLATLVKIATKLQITNIDVTTSDTAPAEAATSTSPRQHVMGRKGIFHCQVNRMPSAAGD